MNVVNGRGTSLENVVAKFFEAGRAELNATLRKSGPKGLQKYALELGLGHSVCRLTPFRFALGRESDFYPLLAAEVDNYPVQTFPDSKVRLSLTELRKGGEVLGKALAALLYINTLAVIGTGLYALLK